MTDTADSTARGTGRSRRVVVTLLMCAFLGALTTLATALAAAVFVRIDRAPANIALDGDHVKPFLIGLERPGASRVVWFAKERVYSSYTDRPTPANASSVGVACWSFASGRRGDPATTTEPMKLPERLAEVIEPEPHVAWGGALDRRGFPFLAFEGLIVGAYLDDPRLETDPDSGLPKIFRSEHAFSAREIDRLLDQVGIDAPGPPDRQNLMTERVVPYRPLWGGLVANTLIYGSIWWVLLFGVASTRRALRRRHGRCGSCGYRLSPDLGERCPECGRANHLATPTSPASPARQEGSVMSDAALSGPDGEKLTEPGS